MSLRSKVLALLAILGFSAILAGGAGLVALHRSTGLMERSSSLGDVALVTERINGLVTGVVMEARGIYMSRSAQDAEPFAKGLETRLGELRKQSALLQRYAPQDPGTAEIAKAIETFIAFRSETVRLGREVSPAAANQQGNNETNRANRKLLNDLLTGFAERNEVTGNTLEADSRAFTAQVGWMLPLALAIVLIGAFATAFVMAQRSLISPLLDLSGSMKKLTDGDTSAAVPHLARKDEIGGMARAVAHLRESTIRVAELQEQERASQANRLARAQSMERVVTDVGEVVEAAAAGDFSARLSIADRDEQMQRLVDGINRINGVMDAATIDFTNALQAIAQGDLTQKVDSDYSGRFAELKGAINETVDRLSGMVHTIQVTSADVGLAAREINMGADDLSKRTEDQASSLEETAATTEELAASVKASAGASRQAATIADEAMAAAESGGEIAGQAVEAMARIEQASQKISDIIRVIDDIAFQTNLLALNAAVEAARAGDAGKGFAVVASEVRTLAQRSGEAAKDISALISSSNNEVGEGVKLVRQAGEALTRIRAASQKVAATIADISTASGEQANGIEEMSQAVAHLDEMTQANAALAEQSAASAASLSGKIGELNQMVSAFRTGRPALTAPMLAPVAAPRSQPRPAPVAKPAMRQAMRPQASASEVAGAEPARLQQLAEAAFAQSRAPVRAAASPARKVANSRDESGWEEF